jgi:hypothetical protein
MPSYEPDPSSVFSQQQWAEIAQSIGHDEIPHDVKQQICDTLFQYRMTDIKSEDLGRFVEEAQKFRASASKVENFLRVNFEWHNKFEDLLEDIYQLQRFVDRELERRPKPKGGRPPSIARDTLVSNLSVPYERMTGAKPARSEDPDTGQLTGPFPRFLIKIFEFHGVCAAGLKHAIDRLTSGSKNRG